jgi:hypothetical protein
MHSGGKQHRCEQDDLRAQGLIVAGFGQVGQGHATVCGQGDPGQNL